MYDLARLAQNTKDINFDGVLLFFLTFFSWSSSWPIGFNLPTVICTVRVCGAEKNKNVQYSFSVGSTYGFSTDPRHVQGRYDVPHCRKLWFSSPERAVFFYYLLYLAREETRPRENLGGRTRHPTEETKQHNTISFELSVSRYLSDPQTIPVRSVWPKEKESQKRRRQFTVNLAQ